MHKLAIPENRRDISVIVFMRSIIYTGGIDALQSLTCFAAAIHIRNGQANIGPIIPWTQIPHTQRVYRTKTILARPELKTDAAYIGLHTGICLSASEWTVARPSTGPQNNGKQRHKRSNQWTGGGRCSSPEEKLPSYMQDDNGIASLQKMFCDN